MRVQTSKKSFLTLESVAMTDIVMNLFIFFFISFSLLYTFNPERSRESKIEVKLPEGSVKGQTKTGEPVLVTITSGNEIYLNEARVLPGDLQKELSARPETEKTAGVLVRSDRSASVDFLVKALDAAKQAGIQKLGVAIRQES